jgi:hypothetical protein
MCHFAYPPVRPAGDRAVGYRPYKGGAFVWSTFAFAHVPSMTSTA